MKTILSFCIFISFLLPITATSTTSPDVISLTLPQAVIADTLKRTIPLTFNSVSSKMEGTITIADISNLQIHEHMLSCHLSLTGDNLNIITNVAGSDIKLKLGSARADFDCDAQIRFDKASGQLFIRPIAKGVDPEDALNQGDIGKGLLTLLNGHEFALAVQVIKPIIAEASNKIITINTRILDIRSLDGKIEISLYPQITTALRD